MEIHFNTFLDGFIADTCNWGMFFSFHWFIPPPFPLQVKELISVEGDGGFKLLSTAIGTEKVNIFKAAMITIFWLYFICSFPVAPQDQDWTFYVNYQDNHKLS